jgi:hypothetical protein
MDGKRQESVTELREMVTAQNRRVVVLEDKLDQVLAVMNSEAFHSATEDQPPMTEEDHLVEGLFELGKWKGPKREMGRPEWETPTLCTARKTESFARNHHPQKKRIAFVLRGQAFRDWGGQHMQSSCCTASFTAQREIFYSHQQMFELWESEGYAVDVFATMYKCTNGKNLANLLPVWYGSRMKRFCRIPLVNTHQGMDGQTLAADAAVGLARDFQKAHDFKYFALVLMRWDMDGFLPTELLSAELPLDNAVFTNGNHDMFLLLPSDFIDNYSGWQDCDTAPVAQCNQQKRMVSCGPNCRRPKSDCYKENRDYNAKVGLQLMQNHTWPRNYLTTMILKNTGQQARDSIINVLWGVKREVGGRYSYNGSGTSSASGDLESQTTYIEEHKSNYVAWCQHRANKFGTAATRAAPEECPRRFNGDYKQLWRLRAEDNPAQCDYWDGQGFGRPGWTGDGPRDYNLVHVDLVVATANNSTSPGGSSQLNWRRLLYSSVDLSEP